MEVKATMKPGHNGTKKYLQKYGDQLVCVRYRYDKKRNKRQTTIELRVKAKETGAYWDASKKAWILSLREVYNLGLEKRIIDDPGF